MFQPCTCPWIYSSFMPDGAQALYCPLMDLKKPGDPGPASLASPRVEFCCRGVMVGVWLPKPHGIWDAHSFVSPGSGEAQSSGSQREPRLSLEVNILHTLPRRLLSRSHRMSCRRVSHSLLSEYWLNAHGICLMATQARACPLHQICLQEVFCTQQRRKRFW